MKAVERHDRAARCEVPDVGEGIAERDPDGPGAWAVRSEVVKALLMGGAHKPAGWSPREGETLDRQWGAGIVDIDRALLMLASGNTAPGPTIQRYGWAITVKVSPRASLGCL